MTEVWADLTTSKIADEAFYEFLTIIRYDLELWIDTSARSIQVLKARNVSFQRNRSTTRKEEETNQ